MTDIARRLAALSETLATAAATFARLAPDLAAVAERIATGRQAGPAPGRESLTVMRVDRGRLRSLGYSRAP